MPDQKISELTTNSTPSADNSSVPIIQSSVVNNVTVFTNFRTTIRELVTAGLADSTQVDGGTF